MIVVVSQRILRLQSFSTSSAPALRNAVEPRPPRCRSSLAFTNALLMRPMTVFAPIAGGTAGAGRGPALTGDVPIPSTTNTGPPGPSVIRSPSRTGTAAAIFSLFRNVPFLLPASSPARPPGAPAVVFFVFQDLPFLPPGATHRQPAGGTDRQLGVHARDDAVLLRHGPDLALLASPDPDTGTDGLETLPAGSGYQRYTVLTNLGRVRRRHRGGLELGVFGEGLFQRLRYRDDRDARSLFAETEMIARLDPSFGGEALSLEEGVVPTPGVEEAPAGVTKLELRMEPRYDTGVVAAEGNLAGGIPTQAHHRLAQLEEAPRRGS